MPNLMSTNLRVSYSPQKYKIIKEYPVMYAVESNDL